jgi:hypothetical protein
MSAQYGGKVKVKRPTGPVDEVDRRRRLNERLRAEYIAGAEAEWRKRTGRLMTARSSSGSCGVIQGMSERPRSALRQVVRASAARAPLPSIYWAVSGPRRYLRYERPRVATVMTRKIVPEMIGTGVPALGSGWATQNSG